MKEKDNDDEDEIMIGRQPEKAKNNDEIYKK